jgi:Zn-dependent metalloprotease
MKTKITLIFFLISFLGVSQVIDTSYLSGYDQTTNYYFFKKNIFDLNSKELKSECFKVQEDLKLKFYKEKVDELGMIHKRYIQTFHDVPIFGTEFFVHCNNSGFPIRAKGKLLSQLNLNHTPTIEPENAIRLAVDACGAERYVWQDSISETNLKEETNNRDASYFPKPQLVVVSTNNTSSEYFLAYKVRITSIVPVGDSEYFVDAHTGRVVRKISRLREGCTSVNHQERKKQTKEVQNSVKDIQSNNFSWCNDAGCQTGSANLKWYGLQNIMTDRFTWGTTFCRYRLKNTCNSTFIYVRDPGGGDYRNVGNSWGNNYQSSTTALWGAERTYEFFKNTFNRNSFDNANSQINIFTENPIFFDNAAWWNNQLHFGTILNNTEPAVAVDIVGHEFTHAIDDYEAGLIYERESGALDESFADIFGTMVEFYALQNFSTPASPNFINGEYVTPGGLRDMSNPKSKSQPDTYLSTANFWFNTIGCTPTGGPTGNDFCGVHTNSGIQNHWFFLLCQGGSDTNDNSDSYCVQGIGMTAAGRIAYRCFTQELQSTSGYIDARAGSIQAAIDLYGANSNEVAQVTQAWFAVGVGNAFSGTIAVSNHTATSVENYKHNSTVHISNFVAQAPSGEVTVTSNTEIGILPNTEVEPGAIFNAYIATLCNGNAARSANLVENTAVEDNKLATVTANELISLPSPEEIKVTPNPSEGLFNVSLDNRKTFPDKVSLIDIMGRVVAEVNNIHSYNLNIDISNLSDGAYVVKAVYPSQVITRRVVKRSN